MFKEIFFLENRRAVWLCLLGFVVYAQVLFYKYVHFGYCDWDLAFFSQAMWNMLHGSIHVSLPDINFMGDHAHFITFLLLPLYWLAPHPLTLLLSKVVIFIASAWMLYVIAARVLDRPAAFILTALYLVFPANIFSMLYQYNVENYAPVFLFALWYFYKSDNRRGFMWCALLACTIKENIPLIVFMFGVHALFFKKEGKKFWAAIPMIMGAALFYWMVSVVIPHFRGSHEHSFWVRYHQLGATPSQVLLSLADPRTLWAQVATSYNAQYLIELFGPFLPLMALSADVLLMIVPVLFYHLVSLHGPEHTIFYHYGLTLTPFIFIAAIGALARIKDALSTNVFGKLRIFFLGAGLVFALAFQQDISDRIDYHHDHLASERWDMVRRVPPDAGVVASFDFLAELSSRKHLYAFHKVYFDLYQDPKELGLSEISSGKPFKAGSEVTYALIDFRDPWFVESWKEKPAVIDARVHKFLKDFTPVRQENSVILFKRK